MDVKSFTTFGPGVPYSGALERYYTQVGSGLTGKHQSRLEKTKRSKHSNTLAPFIRNEENKVLRIRFAG
jgi:hypothetical protein